MYSLTNAQDFESPVQFSHDIEFFPLNKLYNVSIPNPQLYLKNNSLSKEVEPLFGEQKYNSLLQPYLPNGLQMQSLYINSILDRNAPFRHIVI